MTRPNILLILADDMGYSDIGCFGSEIRTPNVDRLAADGVRFSQFYNCARCCPTRASLLTGLYPHQAGVGHMVNDLGLPAYQGFLNDRCVTIAEALGPAGYFCGLAGKWHVGGMWPRRPGPEWRFGDARKPLPTDRGFDRYLGCPGGGSYFYISPLVQDDRLIDCPPGCYSTDLYTDAAVSMAEQAVADDKPFFIHLTYQAPHWPLHAWPEDIERYRGRYAGGWDAVRTARHEQLKGLGLLDPRWAISPRDPDSHPWPDDPNREWQAQRMAVYAAQIDRMDQGIGRLLATLDRLGVADDTLVMFLSDNGGCAEFLAENGRREAELPTTLAGAPVRVGNSPAIEPGGPETFMSYDLPWANASNSPFRLFKHWVHEGGIGTPLVARWPGRIEPGRVTHAPGHVIDLMPTCLAAAGVEYPAEYAGRPVTPVEGESLLPAFADTAWRRDRPIFWEHEGNRAVRADELKLVSRHPGQWELYDMSRDRTELDDLAGRYPDRTAELVRLYDDWSARCGVADWNAIRPGRYRAT